MIIIRGNKNKAMIEKITARLDKDHIYDYDVLDRVDKESISVKVEPNNELTIYIPLMYEYSQYDIDDYIRSLSPLTRTTTNLDRNIYVMKLSNKLTEPQLYKLIRYIIEEFDFCVLINE